jgi:hypothetical protein
MFIARKTLVSDVIGASASALCFFHCIATPFLFVAKACSAACCSHEGVPTWWKTVDYIFLVISFIAIYHTTKSSTKNWIKSTLWGAWILLLVGLLNKALHVLLLPESFAYFPALTLISVHLYNLKFHRNHKEDCCV